VAARSHSDQRALLYLKINEGPDTIAESELLKLGWINRHEFVLNRQLAGSFRISIMPRSGPALARLSTRQV
jgi:hypothetical protein